MEQEDATEFFGTVMLRSYVSPNGGNYQKVTGIIQVQETIDAIGLKVSRSESNWFAVVRGTDSVYYAPGCEVLGILAHSHTSCPTDSFLVP